MEMVVVVMMMRRIVVDFDYNSSRRSRQSSGVTTQHWQQLWRFHATALTVRVQSAT
jgi:hypothetical protein